MTTVNPVESSKMPPATDSNTVLRRAVVGASFGNMVEWFDYASYGYLAATIAGVFFAPGNETMALLGTFGIFALSFVVRPVGGLVWGHYGDRLGRKRVLALTIIIMSASTFAIAFIPGYASIGAAAPIVLLFFRLIQGFSAAGEYAGAASFIAEYAPDNRRGLLVSMVPASTAAGLVLGAIVATLLEVGLSDAALYNWGWRIPFLIAGPLGLIGLYIRLKLEDTPAFEALEEKMETAQAPILQTLNENWRQILVAFGVVCLNAVGFYTILSYFSDRNVPYPRALQQLRTIVQSRLRDLRRHGAFYRDVHDRGDGHQFRAGLLSDGRCRGRIRSTCVHHRDGRKTASPGTRTSGRCTRVSSVSEAGSAVNNNPARPWRVPSKARPRHIPGRAREIANPSRILPPI